MTHPLAFALGTPEIVLIAVVVILLFGSTRIPALMKGMGQGIGEFKKGLKAGGEEAAANFPPPERPQQNSQKL